MTDILDINKITKEMALFELNNELSQEETDEFLDIISAISKGQLVYAIVTNKGEYLMYVDKEIDEE